jgi:hypothetical protein
MGTASWAWRSYGVVLTSTALAACSGTTGQPSQHGVDASVTEGGSTTDAPSGSDTGAEAGGHGDGGDTHECAVAGDCPKGLACDLTTLSCTETCGATQPCNGGCCAGEPNGTCQEGILASACGNTGRECASCSAGFISGTTGSACEPVAGGGQCGCASATQCPPNTAGCDKTTGRCVFSCSPPGEPCMAGCCGSTSACEPGTNGTACGMSGACVNCTGNLNGSACVAGTCGCQGDTDCPAQYSCNTTMGKCTMP